MFAYSNDPNMMISATLETTLPSNIQRGPFIPTVVCKVFTVFVGKAAKIYLTALFP